MPGCTLSAAPSLASQLFRKIEKLDNETYSKAPLTKDKSSVIYLWKELLSSWPTDELDLKKLCHLPCSIIFRYAKNLTCIESATISDIIDTVLGSLGGFCEKISNGFSKAYKSEAEELFVTIVKDVTHLISFFRKVYMLETVTSIMAHFTTCVHALFKSFPKYVEYWELSVRVFRLFIYFHYHPPKSCEMRTDLELCSKDLQCYLVETRCKGLGVIGILCSVILELNLRSSRVDVKSYCDFSLLKLLFWVSSLLSKFILCGSDSNCRFNLKQKVKRHKDYVGAIAALYVPLSIMMQVYDEIPCEKLLSLSQETMQLISTLQESCLAEGCLCSEHTCGLYNKALCFQGLLFYEAKNWKGTEKCLTQCLPYFANAWELPKKYSEVFSQIRILHTLVCCYEKMELYDKAKAVILLTMVSHNHTECELSLGKMWCSLQSSTLEDLKTSLQYLQENFSFLLSLWPSLSKINITDDHILLWELKCYNVHRILVCQPILQAWNTLQTYHSPPMICLQGAVYALRALLSIGSSTIDAFDGLITSDFSNTIKEICEDQHFKALGLLAVLTQYRANFHAVMNAKENTAIIKSSRRFATTSVKVLKPDDVPNPDDSSSFYTTSRALSVQKERQIIELLNQSLQYWEEASCKAVPSSGTIDQPFSEIFGNSLVQTAFLFVLYGHNSNAGSTWLICCKIASKIKSDDLLLQALCGLMNTMECKQSCIAKAEALFDKLSSHPRRTFLQLLYYSSRAFHALRTKKYEEGLTFLSKAPRITPSYSNIWCFIYVRQLTAAYALLPGFYNIPAQYGHCSPALLAQSGMEYALDSFKKKIEEKAFPHDGNECAITIQLLNISLWIGRLFYQTKQPRQARAFLATELLLTQGLGLATRTAEYLCELAQVDLVCANWVDCKLKIEEIKVIVGKTANTDVQSIKPIPLQGNLASPNLREVCSVLLHLHHDIRCKCYRCSNITIQFISLLLWKMQANISSLQFDFHEAYSAFKSGEKFAANLLKRHEIEKTTSGILFQQHAVRCAVVALEMDFGDMLLLYGKTKQACKMNESTLMRIQELYTTEPYLLAEAMEQKLCLGQTNLDQQNASQGSLSSKISSKQITPVKGNIPKTPVNKVHLEVPQGATKRLPMSPMNSPSMNGHFR